MEKDLVKNTQNNFESIKHIDENGLEFWYARELMTMLEYSKWGNFKNVINKAKEACKGSDIAEAEHFADAGETKPKRYHFFVFVANGDYVVTV